jgi:hypothetical protein
MEEFESLRQEVEDRINELLGLINATQGEPPIFNDIAVAVASLNSALFMVQQAGPCFGGGGGQPPKC